MCYQLGSSYMYNQHRGSLHGCTVHKAQITHTSISKKGQTPGSEKQQARPQTMSTNHNGDHMIEEHHKCH